MHATLRKLSGLAVLAALVCVPAHAQQQSSQSGSNDAVAEAAKKAREQKKEAPKPKKVYTDDDISTKKSDISIVGPAPAPNGNEHSKIHYDSVGGRCDRRVEAL